MLTVVRAEMVIGEPNWRSEHEVPNSTEPPAATSVARVVSLHELIVVRG
jgi:hypothetical protein